MTTTNELHQPKHTDAESDDPAYFNAPGHRDNAERKEQVQLKKKMEAKHLMSPIMDRIASLDCQLSEFLTHNLDLRTNCLNMETHGLPSSALRMKIS